MTNQASEDIDNILFEAIKSAGRYDHRLTADEADYIQEQAKAKIESTIRTEKLKLLAEVRERVVGTKDLKLSDIYGNDWRNNYGYAEGQVRDAANHLQRKQLKSLTKLEAEL